MSKSLAEAEQAYRAALRKYYRYPWPTTPNMTTRAYRDAETAWAELKRAECVYVSAYEAEHFSDTRRYENAEKNLVKFSEEVRAAIRER